MITTKFYLDTRNKKKDETFPIKVNVTNNRRTFFINVGLSAKIDYWENNQFTDKEPNYRAKNMKLRDTMNKIEKIVFEIEESGRAKSISNKILKQLIENRLFGKEDTYNFIYYLDKFLENKIKDGTKRVYTTTRGKIIAFDKSATFETITTDWLLRFENWLLNTGVGINYIGIQMRNIRAVFNYAIDNEYTSLYPFRRFKIKKEETIKRSLEVEDLRTLRDYQVEPYQERYRDMFMLMFYLIGINAVDLFSLPPLKTNKIVYHRAKTNRLYEIKIEPEAMAIIQKYKGEKYMLNILDEYNNYMDFLHWMNVGLKKIGKLSRVGQGGKKIIEPCFPELSTYWSRHTWATIAASLDIPKETIAAALGHSSNSVTDIYIRFDKKKIDEANRMVIDFLNK